MRLWIRNNIRKWLGIARNLELIRYNEKAIEAAETIIRERTKLHVDISARHNGLSTIILIGEYHNKDYIRVHSIIPDDFKHLVHIVRDMTRYAHTDRLDTPIGMEAVVRDAFSKY